MMMVVQKTINETLDDIFPRESGDKKAGAVRSKSIPARDNVFLIFCEFFVIITITFLHRKRL